MSVGAEPSHATPKSQHPYLSTLFHFLMRHVLSAELAELVSLQPVRIVLLVFHGRVIPLLAERTRHIDNFTHLFLLETS
jgi:hypothetical protein